MNLRNCGRDRDGRKIGYSNSGRCDHQGCCENVSRGLANACGEVHGEDLISCDKYYCIKHIANPIEDAGRFTTICDECRAKLLSSGQWVDVDGGLIRKVK